MLGSACVQIYMVDSDYLPSNLPPSPPPPYLNVPCSNYRFLDFQKHGEEDASEKHDDEDELSASMRKLVPILTARQPILTARQPESDLPLLLNDNNNNNSRGSTNNNRGNRNSYHSLD